MAGRRLVRSVAELRDHPVEEAEDERRTSERVDFFVERAIDEVLRGIEPEWGPISLHEGLIMRLRLAASSGPTTTIYGPGPDEVELCADGWEVPCLRGRLRPRSR